MTMTSSPFKSPKIRYSRHLASSMMTKALSIVFRGFFEHQNRDSLYSLTKTFEDKQNKFVLGPIIIDRAPLSSNLISSSLTNNCSHGTKIQVLSLHLFDPTFSATQPTKLKAGKIDQSVKAKMDTSKLNCRCIVCDVETKSLCELHSHQSTNHSPEELSLSILTLQSFLYHKHYFQSLDASPPSNICYFYPFCTQLFSSRGKSIEENFKMFCPSAPRTADLLSKKTCSISETTLASQQPYEISSPKQTALRLPLTTATRPTIIKALNSPSKQANFHLPDATLGLVNSHTTFVTSANELCNDLMKLKGHSGQSKIKCKRLNERKEREKGYPRPIKRMTKPPRKPKIDNLERKMPTIFPKCSEVGNLNTETLNIWPSKSEESASLDSENTLTEVNIPEKVQSIKIESPTVPVDIMNCENALIFDAETGSFQWNPLIFVEKKSEENDNAPKHGHVPESALPGEPTAGPDNC
ncbi:uncharacterized protein LOC135164626 [Diachasmimorpha longicaudata]|uniref:uncharacterized protein LOC135164626 n=1 Tax=Diachasmimorpha longicaudata TaxID=58733 RepID=UPI0030B8B342